MVIIVIVIIIAVSGGKETESAPIKIGFIGPLTGDASAFGEPIMNGLKMAEKEINDAAGTDGQKIQIIYEDGKCSGTDATSAVQKLINIDKVKFIIGGICSGELLSFGPVAEQAHVLVISPGATNPSISQLGDYIFRNVPSDALRGTALANYAAKSYKKVAVISEQSDYAQGIEKTFLAQASTTGLTIVANEDFAPTANDFRTLVSKIKQSAPEIILLNPQTPANLVKIAKQIRDLGIKAPIITSEFNDPTVLNAGAATEGIVISVAPGLAANGKAAQLLSNYKTMFGKDAAYPFYVGAAYDGLHMYLDGIKQFGEDPTKVKDYLYSLKDYDGTIGKYSFDKDGELVGIGFIFQKITDGKAVDL